MCDVGSVRVFYLDAGELPLPPLSQLPLDRQERVRSALSAAKARELAWVWVLLSHAFHISGLDAALLTHCRRTAAGKPEPLGSEVRFSLSHSDGWVACAVSETLPLGLDIQKCRSIPARFYAPYLTPEELAATPDTPEALCRMWSRKEAALKWLGTGWTQEARRSLSVLSPTLTLNGTRLSLSDRSVAPGVCLALCAAQGAQVHVQEISRQEARDWYRTDG